MKTNENEIASLAYSLWEKAGRPAGRDMEFWLEAETQLAKERQTVSPALTLGAAQLVNEQKGTLTTPRGLTAPSAPQYVTNPITAGAPASSGIAPNRGIKPGRVGKKQKNRL